MNSKKMKKGRLYKTYNYNETRSTEIEAVITRRWKKKSHQWNFHRPITWELLKQVKITKRWIEKNWRKSFEAW